MTASAVSPRLRQQIDRRAGAWLAKKFSRLLELRVKGFGRFDLAYFRHTDEWYAVHRGLTAAECFREIEANEVFWPTT